MDLFLDSFLDPLNHAHPIIEQGSLSLVAWTKHIKRSFKEGFRSPVGRVEQGNKCSLPVRIVTLSCWYCEWEVDPISCSIQPFLADLYEEGLLREGGDWMVLIDLKDAYLSVTIWEGHCKYLRFPWQLVRVSVPSLQPKQCPSCLHQATKACPYKTLSSGYEVNNILGQYVGDGQEQGETGESFSSDKLFWSCWVL